jgi:hypothetical protein
MAALAGNIALVFLHVVAEAGAAVKRDIKYGRTPFLLRLPN